MYNKHIKEGGKNMEYKQGTCPVCGSENVKYDVLEAGENEAYYPVICEDCHATWEEYYNLIFNGCYNIEKGIK